ncbi:MAG: DNA translocase FtsK [Phycisphaerales bacterium]
MARNAAASRRGSAPAADEFSPARTLRRAGWIILLATWIFTTLALVSFDPADAPSQVVAVHNSPAANLCGAFGAAVSWHLYRVVGIGIWVLVVGTAVFLVLTAARRPVGHPVVRCTGLVLVAAAVSTVHALFLPNIGPIVGARAGLIATALASELTPRFSLVGSSLIVLTALVIGAIVAVDVLVLTVFRLAVNAMDGLRRVPAAIAAVAHRMIARPRASLATAGAAASRTKAAASDRARAKAERAAERAEAKAAKAAAKAAAIEAEEESAEADAEGEEDWEWVDEDGNPVESPEAWEEDWDEEEEDEDEEEDDADVEAEWDDDEADEEEEEEDEPEAEDDVDAIDEVEAETEWDEDEEDEDEDRPLTDEELREKIAALPVRMAQAPGKTKFRDEDIPRTDDFRDYQFPTLDLLKDPETNFSEQMEAEVRQQAEHLERALHTYGIDGEVVGIDSGPAVTLYSVQLAAGTKVSKVSAVATDIARSLAAQNIRIVPNMVGKTAIGIEVPNASREKVRLKELMSGGHASGMVLPMFLGKDASGEPLVADLTKMPHMLIAGTTGSGKSVCMNTILMSWLYTKRPDELKLVLVDPKMVEMSQFQDIPHLMCPVVTESARAAAILEWAVERMEERYELLKEARVQNIKSYNSLTEDELYDAFDAETDEEKARIPKKMFYMVFVIDELADLMMTNKEVEHSIVRIAQKARAVGIHLVLATQRPQANVVTGLIKANMPCRVSFKVASGMDSRIVLDSKGAELLLGQGDMMLLQPSSSELMRSQGTLVEDTEIRKVTRFLKTVAQPSFERSLIALRATQANDGGGGGGELDPNERDPLFERAVEVMIESGRGSVSLLQRRLAIGYGRASRLVDQMGLAGIVGDHKGSVAREVLITAEDWQRMKSMEDEEARRGTVFEEDDVE